MDHFRGILHPHLHFFVHDVVYFLSVVLVFLLEEIFQLLHVLEIEVLLGLFLQLFYFLTGKLLLLLIELVHLVYVELQFFFSLLLLAGYLKGLVLANESNHFLEIGVHLLLSRGDHL